MSSYDPSESYRKLWCNLQTPKLATRQVRAIESIQTPNLITDAVNVESVTTTSFTTDILTANTATVNDTFTANTTTITGILTTSDINSGSNISAGNNVSAGGTVQAQTLNATALVTTPSLTATNATATNMTIGSSSVYPNYTTNTTIFGNEAVYGNVSVGNSYSGNLTAGTGNLNCVALNVTTTNDNTFPEGGAGAGSIKASGSGNFLGTLSAGGNVQAPSINLNATGVWAPTFNFSTQGTAPYTYHLPPPISGVNNFLNCTSPSSGYYVFPGGFTIIWGIQPGQSGSSSVLFTYPCTLAYPLTAICTRFDTGGHWSSYTTGAEITHIGPQSLSFDAALGDMGNKDAFTVIVLGVIDMTYLHSIGIYS